MKIVILGANGQLGSSFFQMLKQQLPAVDVVGTTRGGGFSTGDVRIKDDLLRFDPFEDNWGELGEVSILINCIGQIRETREASFAHIHIKLAKLILANSSTLGHPHILQLSALGAGEHHDIRFLSTKAEADRLLLAGGNTCVIRPSIVCTPHTMLVQKLKLLQAIASASLGYLPTPKGFLDTKIQPIMIADLNAVIYACCKQFPDQRILEIAGPEAISFRKLIKVAANGQKINFVEVPRPVITPSVKYFVAPLLPGILSFDQYQLLFRDNTSSNRDFEELTGQKPLSTWGFWEQELAGKLNSSNPPNS